VRSLRSILLTGGAGFVGSSLARHLLALPEVECLVVLDRLTGGGKRGNLIGPDQDPRFVFVEGDVGNGALIRHLLELHEATGIFHLAAETPVAQPDGPDGHASTFLSANVSGTNTMLEAARLASVPFLHCSTDQVYGSVEAPDRFTEESALQPVSLYDVSKASADLLCLAASANRQQEVVITRSSRNYGPRQHAGEFIPTLVSGAIHDEELTLDGEERRIHDWIHVDDHCCGMIMAFTRGPSGNIFNFGGNCERTNLGIARSILALFGKPESLLETGSRQSGHPRRSAVDSGKAVRYFGWTPKCQFQTAFPAVIRELAADFTSGPIDPSASRWAPPPARVEKS
jgi:dTDP-glucose 4,6-dehydratase